MPRESERPRPEPVRQLRDGLAEGQFALPGAAAAGPRRGRGLVFGCEPPRCALPGLGGGDESGGSRDSDRDSDGDSNCKTESESDGGDGIDDDSDNGTDDNDAAEATAMATVGLVIMIATTTA